MPSLTYLFFIFINKLLGATARSKTKKYQTKTCLSTAENMPVAGFSYSTTTDSSSFRFPFHLHLFDNQNLLLKNPNEKRNTATFFISIYSWAFFFLLSFPTEIESAFITKSQRTVRLPPTKPETNHVSKHSIWKVVGILSW